MKDETIISNSNIGKHLNKVIRKEQRTIQFKGRKFPLIGIITLGRDSTNTFVIEDKLASRNHALIQKIKEVFYLKDLNSTNGTFLNNQSIPENKYVKLNKGDVIGIGKTELTIF
ncbi:FHA domain-containing protein [Spirochaeta cellobiosiphila]|uniref:FHA domain-containing protein n=1 Tax=Spirochaeta cellobiosiphila TaxID=504483 RepID=UPI0004248717|nr:FHA domain-containing protein [Spirochaeta cellobiosiphila]